MNYKITITMNYTVLAGGTGSVVQKCTADLNNIKPVSSNIGGGRRNDEITGNFIIDNKKGDYDAFGTYLNDSDYYVDEEDYSYDLYINGIQYNTNNLRLIGHNKESKELTFKLYDDCITHYNNIYENIDTEINILTGVAGTGNITNYTDFRTLTDLGGTARYNRSISSQTNSEAIIDAFIEEYEDKIPYKIEFVNTGLAQFTPTVYYYQFDAIGYYNDGIAEPPSGIDWCYDSDVSSQPKFVKKPKLINVGYSYWSSSSDYTANMYIEAEANITYDNVVRDLQDTIEYLVGKADSSIIFDSNSFDGLDDVQGETIGGSSLFMSRAKIMTVSDFIPTLAGAQKTNAATKGMLSLSVIFSFLERNSFFWYLEEITGSYYFRIQHITTKTLGTSNPDLTNYHGRNYLTKTRNILIEDDNFNKITNSSLSGNYHFGMSEYVYKAGDKSKFYANTRLITDIDHVLDGKSDVVDTTTGEQWVIMSTYQSGQFYVRSFTSLLNGITINNYELSFYWLTKNFLEMPGKIGADGTVYDDDRLQKKKTVEIKLKVENPQDDFDFYSSVDYFGETAEIDSLTKSDIKDSVGILKLKFI